LLRPVEPAFGFLRDGNRAGGFSALTAIRTAVDHLGAHPLVGRRVEGELRELVISCGKTGYAAWYRFVVARSDVRILSLRRQRQLGFLP
jgi:plasmid stabilization system protein ParE